MVTYRTNCTVKVHEATLKIKNMKRVGGSRHHKHLSMQVRWVVRETIHVLLTLIRPSQWVWTEVNFPPQGSAGSQITISLPLQGFLGVFTSRTDRLWAPWISGTNIKGEAKPGRISSHLLSLAGCGRALTWLLNGDYHDTQSQWHFD